MLRPGGRLVFNVWDRLERNVVPDAIQGIMTKFFPDRPPSPNLVSFSYCDPERIRLDLIKAGFGEVAIEFIAERNRSPSLHDSVYAYIRGSSFGQEIETRGSEWLPRVVEATTAALIARFGDGPSARAYQVVLISAVRPFH